MTYLIEINRETLDILLRWLQQSKSDRIKSVDQTLIFGYWTFKVACTSAPIFETIMKRFPIFSVQIINYQIDQMHK